MRQVILLFIFSLTFIATADETVSFADLKHRTTIQWNYDSKSLKFTIQAKGLTHKAFNDEKKDIKTEYGLVLENERASVDNDSICLLFDTNNDGESYYAFLLDYTGKCKNLYVNGLDWHESNKALPRTSTSVNGDIWTAKVTIPMSCFNCQPGNGDIWKAGFARKYLKGGKTEFAVSSGNKFRLSYGYPESRMGWKQLPVPDRYLIFTENLEGHGLKVTCNSRGAIDPEDPSENLVNLSIENTKSEPVKINFQIKDDTGKLLKNISKECPPKQITGIVTDYKITKSTKTVSFILKQADNIIYQSRYPAKIRLPSRTFPTKGKFLTDKLEKYTPKISDYNGMTWSQLAGKNRGPWFSKRFGRPWEKGQWFKLCAEERLIPWMITERKIHHYNDITYHLADIHKYGVKVSLGAQQWENRAPFWKQRGMYGGYLGDPEDYKNYFSSLREGLQKYGDITVAVFTGDENYGQMRKKTVKLFELHKKKKLYPHIEKINKEIREKFGYNKFGIPQSLKDPNRFRWIALKRWVNDFNDKFEKNVVSEVRKINQRVPIFSVDLLGDMISADLSRWRDKRFDIHLSQLNNHLRPNAVNGILQCRIINDLVKPDELWGCTHLEDSGVKMTSREMQDLYTLYFRNGMTGLHTWPLGGRKPWMCDGRFSRPEAWKYFVDTTRNLHQGFKVKIPEKADMAIYLSELSQMSIPSYWDWGGFIEPAFCILGPTLRADFQFISDLSINRGYFAPSDYRLIIAPFLQFTDQKSAQELLNAVKNGATLLVSDPQAFSFMPDGTVPKEQRKQLFGDIKAEPTYRQMKKATSEKIDFLKEESITLKVPPPTLMDLLGKTYRFVPDDTSQVLMRYEDESPAAVIRSYGKGKIILTGFNIYALTSNQPASWDNIPEENLKFFKALLKDRNIKHNLEYAQVRLPGPKPTPVKAKTCISSNALDFRRTLPKTFYNISVGLTYTYKPFPNSKIDIASKGWIPDGLGLLTNRLDVMLYNPSKKRSSVAWKKSGPIELYVNLAGLRKLSEVNIFVANNDPTVKLFGSKDGKSFNLLQTHQGTSDNPEVTKITFSDIKEDCRLMKLQFTGEKPLELIEFEIWEK